ncbi:glutathione S-transferase family protein [Bradyrhizobium sp. WD16]|uniref:glutathione S-transferase family protein n=1 Tax=Bradyrhizobium sp. WD16 TaxID=1521768 RepID=UPI0020A542A5|nr:glutathione S-transferase family protein [Bradyrhizobium sp. WD16]UTD27755.1 glutathione S-transferase family protein [Bradyrhizobium sp. WD16]
MKIFGDLNSGNCLKVKWVSEAVGLRFTWVDVDIMKGESRTPEFLAMNPAGQVPTVLFDDGRVLAQSNAIIRYFARGSRFIPADDFGAAMMDEWLFWEQYSHEPYIAGCRFQLVYLRRRPEELDPERVRRGYAALDRMDEHLRKTRFLLGESVSLADVALLAYTRLAPEGGFDLSRHAALCRWIGEAEQDLGVASQTA